jgi:serine/threonine protein kinase
MNDSLSDRVNSADELVAELVDAFMARVRQGECPDVEEYTRRHPEVAEVLRQVLPALQLMRDVEAGELSPSVPADSLPRELGDFRIVREVGKGGMGIVYEAEQLSLRRRVALKVLPFAATMDPRHLQRFHNEARAAACLDHPHIVKVHAVGSERGVHYFAMKFIEGQSLAELIATQPQGFSSERRPSSDRISHDRADDHRLPAATTQPLLVASTQSAPRDAAHFRRIAEWGIQAAEALEHAHSLGIVHRDIKPGNLMIDAAGKLWVTDFGLARTATDTSLTMTGDILGTLRYMSPEQALAKHGLVDHRTDVYALGATLYELLTLRPAIEGKDRQEILRKIAFEEPPLSRSLDRAIPADLETIVLKAMAKEPADRYATAQELADDLRGFLEDRPIRARRPSWLQHVRRWFRRRQAVVTAATMTLAVTLAVSTALIWRERDGALSALRDLQIQQERAEAQRRRAETNFREAYWALEDLLCAFDTEQGSPPMSVAELKQWQTETALRFLAPFCEDSSEEPAARLQKGAAYVHTGRVYQVRYEREKAQSAFRQAIAVFGRLVQDFPDDPTYPREVATALRILAEDLYQAGQIAEANRYYRQAIGVWRETIRNHPADLEACMKLAYLHCQWFDHNLLDPTAAVEIARKAVEMAPHDPAPWMVLGIAYYRMERWNAATNALQEGFRRASGWSRKLPWTYSLFFLAMAQARCGKAREAMESYQEAIRTLSNRLIAGRDPFTRALHAEASALLRLPEPTTPKDKEGSSQKE